MFTLIKIFAFFFLLQYLIMLLYTPHTVSVRKHICQFSVLGLAWFLIVANAGGVIVVIPPRNMCMENIVGRYSDQVHLHSSKYVLKTKTSNNLSQSFLMHISVLCFFLFWNSNFSFVFLKWNKTFADMFCGESLAAVIKKFAAQLDQIFSLTVGGSVTFWVLVSEHLLSTTLSSIKRLIFFFPLW